MIKIVNNDIEISKGNNAIIDIVVTDNGEPYVLQENERLVFSLKQSLTNKDYLIKKDIIDGQLTINTYETALKAGKYNYDIALIGPNKKDTLIGPSNFYIKEVVNDE